MLAFRRKGAQVGGGRMVLTDADFDSAIMMYDVVMRGGGDDDGVISNFNYV